MSRCINLDSTFRSRDDPQSSENNYIVGADQIESWQRHPRTVTAFPRDPNTQTSNPMSVVELKTLIIPYQAGAVPNPIEYPLLYVQMTNVDGAPVRMIECIDGLHSEATFVCRFRKIQYAADGTTPLWVHFKGEVEQVYPIDLSKPMRAKITSRSGRVITALDTGALPNPALQTLITFAVTPYIRDNTYENHRVTPIDVA